MEREKGRMTGKMKWMAVTLMACMPLMLSAAMQADGDCSSCTVYKGYITGDMQVWGKGMTELQERYNREAGSCTMYALAEARYGYAGFLLGTGDKAAARPLIDAFEKDIEKLATYSEYMAEAEALRVSLLGFRMALNPARAVILGPKALKQLQAAMDADSRCASVWIEKANSEAHMPAFAGGSKEKAVASYREAIRLFEADSRMSRCNWRYLNTMVLLGQLLEKMEDYTGARDAYQRALRREPDFNWVRDELLPAVEKKIK
ncbi:MAG: tetratricopeptide repeat protein [Bacteroidales bacterium]